MTAVRIMRRAVSSAIAQATARYVETTWRSHHEKQTRHSLPGTLAVTLTSFPPRYPTLGLTLKSLLAQSVAPDRVDLWIAGPDLASLPGDVTALQAHGLSIHACDDLRSYKKIMPALVLGAADFLVIADDDVFYPRPWLERLVRSRHLDRNEVVCGRAHRIRLDQAGNPLPYRAWESEIPARAGSALVFPTGIGGVLYEPGMFHPDVTRTDLFQTLCPDSDDLWLYWMAMMNGATFRKVGPRTRPITWHQSQQVGLFLSNAAKGTGNDRQMSNMVARYGGFPVREE